MSKRTPSPAAHYTARAILLILMIASGLAVSFTLVGNSTVGLQICGGGLLFSLAVLLFGGFVVASNRPTNGDASSGE